MKFNCKKGICLALLTALLLAVFPGGAAHGASVTDFTDVKAGSWYYAQVSYAVAQGLFNGTSGSTFSPNDSMTRGMFIAVLGRLAGVSADAYKAGSISGSGVNFRKGPGTGYGSYGLLSRGTALTITGLSGDWYAVTVGSQAGYVYKDYVAKTYHSFSDTSYSQYYTGYAIWAFEKGLVSGTDSADVFSPKQNITREQICKILYNYVNTYGITMKSAGTSEKFTDESSINSWAYNGVSALRAAGVIHGVSLNGVYYFYPQNAATRAEVATIFYGLAQAIASSPPTPTAAPVVTAAPSAEPADTPATLLSDPVALPGDTIKVGLYVKTASVNTAVSSVKLTNCRGGAFEYGYVNDAREFIAQGTVAAGEVVVYSDGSQFSVQDAGGNILYVSASGFALRGTADNGAKPVSCVNGKYRYYGAFEFGLLGGSSSFTLLNVVDLEDYVKGVVPYEFSNAWPLETLKAAAVAVRTYVLSAWGGYASYGFDCLAENGAQTYRGRAITYEESYFTLTDQAADETAGQVLTYGGALCTCFYFSSDGGATEDYGHIYSGSIPYLKGKVDPYDARVAGEAGSYTASVTNARTGSALSALAAKLGLGAIAPGGIAITNYAATGNVQSVTITDVGGKTSVIDQNSSESRWNFLKDFGFTGYSYRFSVSYDAGSDSFTITRSGWGHNLGMSQWGAYAMAKYYGKSYQSILGFYYDGTHLQYGEN